MIPNHSLDQETLLFVDDHISSIEGLSVSDQFHALSNIIEWHIRTFFKIDWHLQATISAEEDPLLGTWLKEPRAFSVPLVYKDELERLGVLSLKEKFEQLKEQLGEISSLIESIEQSETDLGPFRPHYQMPLTEVQKKSEAEEIRILSLINESARLMQGSWHLMQTLKRLNETGLPLSIKERESFNILLSEADTLPHDFTELQADHPARIIVKQLLVLLDLKADSKSKDTAAIKLSTFALGAIIHHFELVFTHNLASNNLLKILRVFDEYPLLSAIINPLPDQNPPAILNATTLKDRIRSALSKLLTLCYHVGLKISHGIKYLLELLNLMAPTLSPNQNTDALNPQNSTSFIQSESPNITPAIVENTNNWHAECIEVQTNNGTNDDNTSPLRSK